MKKVLLSIVILGALLSILACIAVPFAAKDSIKGSGKLTTRTIDAPEFSGIDASRAVKVIISDKTDGKITIQADDNLIDRVTVKEKNGELKIGMDPKIQHIANSDVTVTVPANGHINKLEASSAAQITTAVALAATEFTIDASSAAQIKAAIKADKCEIEASSASNVEAAINVKNCLITTSSAAKVKLSGKADKCTADMSSASKLAAPKLIVTDFLINTSSAASADIYCQGTLNADASSGSSIGYTGDCSANISRSSGGSASKN